MYGCNFLQSARPMPVPSYCWLVCKRSNILKIVLKIPYYETTALYGIVRKPEFSETISGYLNVYIPASNTKEQA